MKYAMLGVMSGTSLDGVDLCRCDLTLEHGAWTFEILRAATTPYPPDLREQLDTAIALAPDQLGHIDEVYADYLAATITAFQRGDLERVTVASHGHTIHHRPDLGYTRQIGSPSKIAALTGYTVVGDFRTADVALGGQGAPLVPVADRLLFGAYAACINLGGFANISYESASERRASDVSVCNLLLDRLAGQAGLAYDDGGRLAASGTPDPDLLSALRDDAYFAVTGPKSLGREWFERNVWPLFWRKLQPDTQQRPITVNDALATGVHHVVEQLVSSLRDAPPGELLVTGGGAFNTYLMDAFRQNLPAGYRVATVPNAIVEYKEALAFALLGALRLRGETNVLASVTGASRDSSSGVIALPTG